MMKKLTLIMVFGTLLGVASGCHVGECWRYAWNSRFHPERNAAACPNCVDPCDPCDPCGDPCGTTVVTPMPAR
jgi:hypothetical protein